jgi:hypothetical protein
MKKDELEREEPDLEKNDYSKEIEEFVRSWEKEF